MDRRSFLTIIPLAATTSKAMAADYETDGPGYKGYRIWEWTGWKTSWEQSILRGQWLAAPIGPGGSYIPLAEIGKRRPLLYVSVPGGEGPYLTGDVFDIGLKDLHGQKEIDKRTPEHIKERERRRGLKRMFRLIDRTVA